MSIKTIENETINPAISYALGLIYPLFKVKKIIDVNYIIGSVNHNAGKVTQYELNEHYVQVYELFKSHKINNMFEIKSNKATDYTISPKLGFSIITMLDDLSTDQALTILNKKVLEIKSSDLDNKKAFVRGCFDGRSSWDTTAHYLSIDVDRDYIRQDLITEIIESLGIKVNLNRRAINHDKNDQIRIKHDSLHRYMDIIGFYSKCRESIVLNGMKQI